MVIVPVVVSFVVKNSNSSRTASITMSNNELELAKFLYSIQNKFNDFSKTFKKLGHFKALKLFTNFQGLVTTLLILQPVAKA